MVYLYIRNQRFHATSIQWIAMVWKCVLKSRSVLLMMINSEAVQTNILLTLESAVPLEKGMRLS